MSRQPQNQGFTLLEMTVVLLILALMMGGIMMPLRAQTEYHKQQRSIKELSEIKDALIGFAIIHGRLPCPSYITDPAHIDFGVESASCGSTVSSDGYLPWKTLGVNETDAWGTRQSNASGSMPGHWRYRVDSNFVNSIQLYTDFSDKLIIKNISGIPITTTIEYPVAIVYSTGPNLRADGENADFETSGGVYQSDVQSTQFDDVLVWITRPILMYRMVSAGKLPS